MQDQSLNAHLLLSRLGALKALQPDILLLLSPAGVPKNSVTTFDLPLCIKGQWQLLK